MDNNINVEPQFENIMGQLREMSTKLEAACVTRDEGEYDRGLVEDILYQIDLLISKSPEIRTARIEGKNDVKNIIDIINKDVLQKLNDLKQKVNEGDKKDIEEVEERYNSNQTNTTQQMLNDFEKELKPLTLEERIDAAEKRERRLTQRIKAAKAWKEYKTTNSPNVFENVEKYSDEANVTLDEIRHRIGLQEALKNPETRQKLTNPEARQKLTNAYNDFCEKIKNNEKLTKEDYETFKETMKQLKQFRIFPQIASIVNGFLTPVPEENTGERIRRVITENPTIDFEDIDQIDSTLAKRNVEQLRELLTTSDIFKLYTDSTIFPGNERKVQKWLKECDGQNSNLEIILNEIKEEITVIIFENIGNIETDIEKLKDLEEQCEKVRIIKEKLIKLQSKQVTTATRKMFGQHLEIKDEAGNPLDLGKIDITPEHIELLYRDLYEKSLKDENIDEQITSEYMSVAPESEKNPGFLKKLTWKLFHPKSWWDGKGLNSYQANKKEEWVRQRIQNEVIAMQNDVKNTESEAPIKSWTLSPDALAKIRANDMERVEKAKALGREAIIDGETKETAKRIAVKNLREEQEDADYDLDV